MRLNDDDDERLLPSVYEGYDDDADAQEEGLLFNERREDDRDNTTNNNHHHNNNATINENLDIFFTRLYQHFTGKGYSSIICTRVANVMILSFTIWISGFLLLYVDWECLRTTCATDAERCEILKMCVKRKPLRTEAVARTFVVLVYLTLAVCYLIWNVLRLAYELPELKEMRVFCALKLGLSDRDFWTITWPEIMQRLKHVQETGTKLSFTRKLDERDIVARIMRKENYLIGMMNKDIVNTSLEPVMKKNWMTKSVQINFEMAVFNGMFDDRFHVRRDFFDVEALRRRFKTLAILNAILSPFLAIFMTMYFVLHNAERFYHQPSTVGTREWSSIGFWRMREFNELPHFARHRASSAHKYATRYVSQFPNPITDIFAKFIAYVVGAFAACALILAFVDDRLLNAYIGNRDVFWLTASLGAALAASRAFIVEENVAFEPKLAMARVVAHTHFFPKHWRQSAHKLEVKKQFADELFPLKATTFFEELMGIFLCPFVLWFPLSDSAGDVVEFVRNSTTRVAGIGDVCSLSVFDFTKHGNKRYGAKTNARKNMRSRQGKMEKSFLSFTEAYPDWCPDEGGIEVLDNLKKFAMKYESVVLSKSLMLATAGGMPGSFMHQSLHNNYNQKNNTFSGNSSHIGSGMLGSSIFRDRNNNKAVKDSRRFQNSTLIRDSSLQKSSNRKFGKTSTTTFNRKNGAVSSDAPEEDLLLLDAWLANTNSSHQVMQCFYERALEKEEDDSANSDSSEYIKEIQEEEDNTFIEDITEVLSGGDKLEERQNVDLI